MIEIGIDIVENKRIKKLLKQYGEKFVKKILTVEEVKQYLILDKKLEFLAGRFCAKEAFFKATKKRFVSFQDICVLNDENGEPTLRIKNKRGAESKIQLDRDSAIDKKFKIKNIKLSLSHSREYTVAVCLIEKYQ